MQPTHTFDDHRALHAVHIVAAMAGKPTRAVIRCRQQRVLTFSQLVQPRPIIFLTADGNSGYNQFYIGEFERWYPVLREFGFTESCSLIRTMLPLYVGDFLHLLKNIRNRLINSSLPRCHRPGGGCQD
jgi:hypothetical protein